MLNSYKTYTLIVMMLFAGIAVAQWSQDPEDAIRLRGIWAGNLVSDSLSGIFILGSVRNHNTYCFHIDANGYLYQYESLLRAFCFWKDTPS